MSMLIWFTILFVSSTAMASQLEISETKLIKLVNENNYNVKGIEADSAQRKADLSLFQSKFSPTLNFQSQYKNDKQTSLIPQQPVI